LRGVNDFPTEEVTLSGARLAHFDGFLHLLLSNGVRELRRNESYSESMANKAPRVKDNRNNKHLYIVVGLEV